MRLCSIASGSSGNCIYAGSDTTHLLIDTGISGKRIEQGLNALGLTGRDIDGILVTHEHADHISGLGIMARKYGVPIYLTPGTKHAIWKAGAIGAVDSDLFNDIYPDETFQIKDISIYPVQTSHDAAQPVAYRLQSEKKSVAVMTDLGVYTDYTVECLRGLDALLIEANHDVNMLQVGPYPYYLKQRILGEKGHLSNESCGRLLSRLLHDKLKAVLLGHLSKENNLEELAYETVRVEITMADTPYRGEDFPIRVAGRDTMSELILV